MKFKSNQAINQRIEQITTEHLVVGIDIAKEVHVAAAVNYRGIQQGRILTFGQDRDGLERLLRWVKEQQKASGLTDVIFGMESTGHYFVNLALQLRERGYIQVLVNPLTTKRNKENRDNKPSKSDAKDAITIADAVSRGYYSQWRVADPVYQRLRCLVDERERLSTDQAALDNQIQNVLDRGFPEFFSVFTEWSDVRARATLKSFPLPADIRELTVDNLIAGWRAEGMKRAGGDSGRRVAVALLVAAKRSIGRANVALELKRSLGRLLERYEALEQQIAAVQQEVEEVLTEVSACAKLPLETLKLSPWLSAVILANTGELSGYADGRQIMALAGLSLCESSSGKRRGQVVLSKRGRSQLRKYLYLTVVGLVQNHSAFKRWHKHNVKTLRMRKGRSILKLVGKLSRLLVGIAHSGETFDERRHPLQPISA